MVKRPDLTEYRRTYSSLRYMTTDEANDWVKAQRAMERRAGEYNYHLVTSSMERIYDSVRDYYNSRDWN